MIILIVNHLVRPGLVDVAARRLDANGDRMRACAGFQFRYRVVSADNPLKLTTVTAWESETAYRAYQEARQQIDPGAAFAGESPYERTDTEMHIVEREDVAPTNARA